MSKPFTAFYDALMPELPGCAPGMLNWHLRDVARDYCAKTSAWRADTLPVDSAADRLTYAVILPEAYADLVRFTRLTVDGKLQWQDRLPDPDDREVALYVPQKPPFTLDEDATLFTLADQPTGQIVFGAAMKPTIDAPELPDVLLTGHLSAIRAGVLSRLMLMGGKKWTDRELAGIYLTEFHTHVNRAADAGARQNVRGPMRTTPTRI